MTTETLISLSAAAISLSAFGVALWQGYVTRKHNRLSVKPMLHFDLGMIGGDFVLQLKNTGVGPALITNWHVTFSDETIGDNPNQIAINLLDELEVGHLGGTVYLPGRKQAMAPGDAYIIMNINDVGSDHEVESRIRNDVQWLKVTFEYESIYGEKYSVSGPAEDDFS